jgi:hypothetical protein
MTTAPPDIPPRVSNRPFHKPLSPAEEDEFLLKQAEFEAAYRCTGDPLALQEALNHAWFSRQTVPGWLMREIGYALIRSRTDEEAERYQDRMRHVRRFIIVRDLRRKEHTKDNALDVAVKILADQRAAASRRTIEGSYDKVERSLKQRGRESEFFYLVALVDERIGCTIGNGGSTVVSDGTLTYVSSDYVGADYQQFNGHTVTIDTSARRPGKV